MTTEARPDRSGPTAAPGPWFPDRGPATVLVEAAARLGLPVDPQDVRRRFERRQYPGTLKSLVEVAAEIGLEVRAFRADLGGLAKVAPPAIVHLQLLDRDESAFGLLLEQDGEGVLLSEGADRPPRRLTMEQFLRQWTGILATITPREGAVTPSAPHAGLLWRVRRRILQAREGEWHQLAARVLAGIATAALAAAGAWRSAGAAHGAAGGLLALAMLVLTGTGIAASRALLLASRTTSVPSATPRLSSRICARGTLADCEGVLASRYAQLFGIGLAPLGLSFLVSCVAIAAVAGAQPGAGAAPISWLSIAFLLASPVSLYLIGVQIYPLRRFCPLCMAVHAIVLAGAVLGALHLARAGAPAAELREALPWAALQALFFFVMVGFGVPYIDLGIEARTNRVRLSWIGATPLGALAELVGRPRDITEPVDGAILVGHEPAPFRLEALVHPACSGCGPVVEQLLELQRERPGEVAVSFHLPPRDLSSREDRELCAALAALGAAAGGEAAMRRFLELERDPWPTLAELARSGTGGETLLARWTGTPADDPRVAGWMERGRRAAAAADVMADRLKRGTPTVLVGGRPWEAPVADLEALIARRPELLAGALGLPWRERGGSA